MYGLLVSRTIHSLLVRDNQRTFYFICATNLLGASVLHTCTLYGTTYSIGTTRLVLEPCRPSPPLINGEAAELLILYNNTIMLNSLNSDHHRLHLLPVFVACQ